METRIFHVDAFSAEPFKGNPAAVCLLESPRPDAWMQNVAAEMNLSETAFLLPAADGFGLRWFTPAAEVPLCGHATLASAHVLWETGMVPPESAARFQTLSGTLTGRRQGRRIEIDLPAMTLAECPAPAAALRALDVSPRWCGRTPNRGLGDMDYLLELDSEATVRSVRPDFGLLGREVQAGVIVTARSGSPSCDFVSRYFVPYCGIDEDPVTGAAHCSLVPYWSRRLGKAELLGYQASARGGYVHGRLGDGRVLLAGEAVTVLRGTLIG
jgi:PhzF family phenazine biosynthesis protein